MFSIESPPPCAAADAAAVGVAGVAAVAGADGAVAAHRALGVRPARVRRARVKPASRRIIILCTAV